jgi:hypothetical protein
MKQPLHVMRLINEATELNSRIDDLVAYINALGANANPAELALLDAQCRAMSLTAKMISARLHLATGVKP